MLGTGDPSADGFAVQCSPALGRANTAMSDESEARRIEPPVVVKNFGDLDGESRSAIRRAAASGHVEAIAGRVRELCAVFDELDVDGLSDDAQEALWRAHDLMEEARSALDEAGKDDASGSD